MSSRSSVVLRASRLVITPTTSESGRLVSGAGLCSGRVEVKSNQLWVSVCEDDFDQQDAEVVCRELGCGAPSVLQGALYGELEGPIWAEEFQCQGNESRLLDCNIPGSTRNTCSPGRAAGLTCSEPDDVRLVGGAGRCAGGLEIRHQGEWRRLVSVLRSVWTLGGGAAVVCRQLRCGSPLTTGETTGGEVHPVWRFTSRCAGSESALRECGAVEGGSDTADSMEVICSDVLFQPNISLSSSMGGVSEGQQQGPQVVKDHSFNITCSIQPQFPGGSFHLTFTGSNTTQGQTRPAVNHSADFLFPAADHAHQGNYSCGYEVYVFSHSFTSESELLSVTVTDLQTAPDSYLPDFLIMLVKIIVLTVLMSITVLYWLIKTTRGQKPAERESMEMVSLQPSVEAEQEEGAAAGQEKEAQSQERKETKEQWGQEKEEREEGQGQEREEREEGQGQKREEREEAQGQKRKEGAEEQGQKTEEREEEQGQKRGEKEEGQG